MPQIVRFYIRHVIVGFALAGLFTAGLLWLDVAGLWHLVTHTDAGPLAAFLLFFFNGIVFAGAQTGIALMLMAEDDPGPGPGEGEGVPVPVAARTRR
jgi:hypothetical protein